jgi:uncharacterized protein YfaA (DUF2138 family)
MEELVYQQNMKTLDVLLNHILDAAPSVKDWRLRDGRLYTRFTDVLKCALRLAWSL